MKIPSLRWAALVATVLPLPSVADASRSGHARALEQLKQMQVAEGLTVGLFAAEPMVVNPTDLDVDARGRVWVTEGANYRSTFQKWGLLRPEGDRIQILEDTNGDGAADAVKTFYQDPSINTALGLCVLGNRVIVSASPCIFVLTDTDGDDVADRRELLFTTNPKSADHDHAAHAFVFGPDGKLYFNFGNAGGFLRRPPASLASVPLHGTFDPAVLASGELVTDVLGRPVSDQGRPYRQGMAFRCDPDGSHLEVLGHNFRNNYEVAVDSFGTVWQPDNDDDGNQGVRVNYVMEGGNFGYVDELTGAGWGKKRINWEKEVPLRHWHLNDPGVVPNLLQTGAGSPTGMAIYEGNLLPAVFRGQMIHCDAGPRVVRAYPVTSAGAGFTATMTNVLSSADDWFRPSDVAVGPDGALYVADWNDAGVGGHYMADQKLETMTGRIYRVAPAGSPSRVPAPNFASVRGAVAALESPNLETRFRAWTALEARLAQDPEAERALISVWQGSDARQRARALALLARVPQRGEQHLAAALKDGDPNLRVTALRLIRQRTTDPLPAVKALVSDPDPAVRREAALALRHQKSPEAAKLWAALARQHDGRDRWYLEALGIGAEGQWDAFLAAWLETVGDGWNTPGGRDLIWRSRAKRTPELLVQVVSAPATPAAEHPRYLRAFDFLSGPEKDAALIQILALAAPEP
ncbi:MAG: HEAT repeat domain-containing protein [Verrucomicrobia bacterium]|nr:HEAT repeat domain-containing protein [Verrucomicrobiota bacterium]